MSKIQKGKKWWLQTKITDIVLLLMRKEFSSSTWLQAKDTLSVELQGNLELNLQLANSLWNVLEIMEKLWKRLQASSLDSLKTANNAVAAKQEIKNRKKIKKIVNLVIYSKIKAKRKKSKKPWETMLMV